ncbi:hypothetical protein PROFUN_11686 [Planoprotostelium fungivorum]|uniref:SH3 domain-containing protein n=1 Tax=Planoprotostelium fungivorum TaxID=1890364 RepID=A0A2P6N599_9EUKA|nr:hypothetical protein PROFUN_11686 [Planoprotostelium fungivorum]
MTTLNRANTVSNLQNENGESTQERREKLKRAQSMRQKDANGRPSLLSSIADKFKSPGTLRRDRAETTHFDHRVGRTSPTSVQNPARLSIHSARALPDRENRSSRSFSVDDSHSSDELARREAALTEKLREVLIKVNEERSILYQVESRRYEIAQLTQADQALDRHKTQNTSDAERIASLEEQLRRLVIVRPNGKEHAETEERSTEAIEDETKVELLSMLKESEERYEAERRKNTQLSEKVAYLEARLESVKEEAPPTTRKVNELSQSLPAAPPSPILPSHRVDRKRPNLLGRADFSSKDDTCLSFFAGDLLFLRKAYSSGWWLAEDLQGNLGKIPQHSIARLDEMKGKKATAIGDFVPERTGDLKLFEGEEVSVLSTEDDWWIVELKNGSIGYAPSNFIQLCQ